MKYVLNHLKFVQFPFQFGPSGTSDGKKGQFGHFEATSKFYSAFFFFFFFSFFFLYFVWVCVGVKKTYGLFKVLVYFFIFKKKKKFFFFGTRIFWLLNFF